MVRPVGLRDVFLNKHLLKRHERALPIDSVLALPSFATRFRDKIALVCVNSLERIRNLIFSHSLLRLEYLLRCDPVKLGLWLLINKGNQMCVLV
jgi:hypothetical protein